MAVRSVFEQLGALLTFLESRGIVAQLTARFFLIFFSFRDKKN